MRLDDHLDLLGIRYDAEMELKAFHEIAERIASYWKVNCTDDDFYKNCLNSIKEELGENAYEEDIHRVWDIIEKNYID